MGKYTIENTQIAPIGNHAATITAVREVTRKRTNGDVFDALEIEYQVHAPEGHDGYAPITALYGQTVSPLSKLGKLAEAFGLVDFAAQDGQEFDPAAFAQRECKVKVGRTETDFACIESVTPA